MAHFQKDGLWVQGGQGALANVSEDTPFIKGQLGKVTAIKDSSGKAPCFYQYVQRYTTEANSAAAGLVAYWYDLDDFIVTADITDAIGGATNPLVAGVFLGASPAAAKYGFIQVGGTASVSVTGTTIAGDVLVADTGTFNQLESFWAVVTDTLTSAATLAIRQPRIAVALTAVDTSTDSAISVSLDVFRNGW